MKKVTINFEDVFKQHSEQIYSFLFNLSGNSEIAKDLSQEVFVKVERNLSLLREKRALKVWLFRIARNHYLDYVRKVAGKPKETELIDNIAGSLDMSLVFEQKEMSSCIRKFVDKLKEPARSIIILKEIEGAKLADIAPVVGVSISAVKMAAFRAKKELKQILSSNCNLFYDERNVFRCSQK